MACQSVLMEDCVPNVCTPSGPANTHTSNVAPRRLNHADAGSHVRFPTIVEAAVVAVFGARDESGKALLGRSLLLLGVSGAMDRVPAWQPV